MPPHPDEEETVPIEQRPLPSRCGGGTGSGGAKKRQRRAKKKASVPSWDEIMFGKKAD